MNKRITGSLTIATFLIFVSFVSARDVSSGFDVQIEGLPKEVKVISHAEQKEEGLELLTFEMESSAGVPIPSFSFNWSMPATGIHTVMTTSWKGIAPDWGGPAVISSLTSQAPVMCMVNTGNQNMLTVAASDALNSLSFKAGIHEEDGTMLCVVKFNPTAELKLKKYKIQLLFDSRGVGYETALSNVTKWWETLEGYRPSPVPEVARLPMYSTWYSFHQQLDVAAMLNQCRLAKGLGCEAIIIDDGWQTLDNGRGYGYCGDWKPERLPDMKALVDSIHLIGMKVILWYSVPYIGEYSEAYQLFKDKFLRIKPKKGGNVGVLDPRYLEVRSYLKNLYNTARADWGLDGFKLDFVDELRVIENTLPTSPENDPRRDFVSVYEAVDVLLTEVMAELRAADPEIMIEFRQSYIGPLMRKYGNIFRAGDCPYDGTTNRVRVTDLRLLSGATAVHSDMLMWHPEETPAGASLQLLNVIFSVPQISVMLDKIPSSHFSMLSFWLKFWKDNRDVLLDGTLKPENPELNYPVIYASTDKKYVAAVYKSGIVANAGRQGYQKRFFINATETSGMPVHFSAPLKNATIHRYTATGEELKAQKLKNASGIVSFDVPPGGLMLIE